MWHVWRRVGRWGVSFPTWKNSVDKGEERKTKKKEIEKEEKPKKKMRGKKSDRKEENESRERKRKNVGKREREIFPEFRRSKIDGPRIKVGPCNESYAWVPKYVSFVKLQEVGNFPTLIISSLKVV